jgi:hypothetical protein
MFVDPALTYSTAADSTVSSLAGVQLESGL